MSEAIEDLTLLLIYLTSWREKVGEGILVSRAWKGYDFDVLNKLNEKGYITGSHRAKSVYLTDEGVEKAEKLGLLYLDGRGTPDDLRDSDDGK
jgi:hypothetical protein